MGCPSQRLATQEREVLFITMALPPPADPRHQLLQQASITFREGRVEEAIALAGRYLADAADEDFAGHVALGQMLLRARRLDELQDLLDLSDSFRDSAEGRILLASLRNEQGSSSEAESLLRCLLEETLERRLSRIVRFQLCHLLDRQGRHAEAWKQATEAHRSSTRHFPVDLLVASLRITAEASLTELAKLPTADHRVTRLACVLGMPRSGTSLLEHMLDGHAGIRALHELPFAGQMADTIAREGGGWPGGALAVSRRTLNQLQATYLQGTRERFQVPDDAWMLDKTVFPMMQPLFLATTLPGAKVLHIQRSARDNAISLFLNNMDPSWGWTGTLESIHRVLEAERLYLPVILRKLQLDVLPIRYEELIRDPRGILEGALTFLDLPFEEACLHPEKNQRLVHTLSEQQVHQPVRDASVGRWQRYAEHFDRRWDALDHD
jgi:hypothetical protein